eukprot:jgi/Hompol1/2151/HPOL_002049-RA
MAPTVQAHGFLQYPGPVSQAASSTSGVRGYEKITTNIDALRTPIKASTPFCRGEEPTPLMDIALANGVDFTITLSFSLNANHIGPCWVEIWDPSDLGAAPVTIASAPATKGCAVKPVGDYATLEGSEASSVCPGRVPPLVQSATNDLCMSEWTFSVSNADQIKCSTCILRWRWEGWHIDPANPEKCELSKVALLL